MKYVKLFEQFFNEKKKTADSPDWHDSDAPDANGRFKELGIKDLAAWLIKTRDKDLQKITGSLNQQITFNKGDDTEYAAKMEKVRKEVYRQLGREDLLEAKPGPDAYMTGLDDETEAKKKEQMKKQAAKADDDDSAYKEMPGDKEAREQGKVKTSKHTKTYHELYGESIDEAKKQSTDRSPIDDEGIETGLKKKADETGVPIGILRAVMRRGMAAWKTGHRPGTSEQQWGYARCNSFLTKQDGTWGGADKDLAKEVRDGGHDKKLK
jgi:hypothetical protein